MSTYLITGGAGFIGSHLAESLVEEGLKVKVLDDLSSGNLKNLSHIPSNKISFYDGSINDPEAVKEAMKDTSGVFHLAALVSVPISIEDPRLSFEINSMGTSIVLDAARSMGLKKLVITSSAAIYGNTLRIPIPEDIEKNPLSPYGLDKLISEQLASLYSELYELDISAMRLFNVFGPRQDPSSSYSGVISILINRLLTNQRPNIYGDGDQSRDFIYVKDVVNGLKLAMYSSIKGFKAYNLGRGRALSLNQVWKKLSENTEHKIEPVFLDERVGDIKHSVADISLISKELGFKVTSKDRDNFLYTYEWEKEALDTKKLQ